MGRVFGAGKACRVVAIGLAFVVVSNRGGARAAPSTSQPSRSSVASDSLPLRQAPKPAPVNPLRDATPQPAPPATAAAMPPAPAGPFVPNTGRLHLFRATDKSTHTVRSGEEVQPSTARGSLFPAGKMPLAAAKAPLRMMRFEDVVKGVELVPVTVPRRAQAAAKDRTPGKAVIDAESARSAASVLHLERLPPVNRTAPRPTLPPGTKLPQEPIAIYPDTGY